MTRERAEAYIRHLCEAGRYWNLQHSPAAAGLPERWRFVTYDRTLRCIGWGSGATWIEAVCKAEANEGIR